MSLIDTLQTLLYYRATERRISGGANWNSGLVILWCQKCLSISFLYLPMSSEPEPVFSGPKLTASDQRNGLKGKTIELLECSRGFG